MRTMMATVAMMALAFGCGGDGGGATCGDVCTKIHVCGFRYQGPTGDGIVACSTDCTTGLAAGHAKARYLIEQCHTDMSCFDFVACVGNAGTK